MITVVKTYPNPFVATLSVDIKSEESHDAILCMMAEDGKIVKMVGWNLKKGNNLTTLRDLHQLETGMYYLGIIDTNGEHLFGTTLSKEPCTNKLMCQ